MSGHIIFRRISLLRVRKISKLFSTSSSFSGRKSRETYDTRFEMTGKDVHQGKKGGSTKYAAYMGQRSTTAQQPGYLDNDGKFTLIPEMIPEFVVPDLTDFKLKPYVSYKVVDVTQSEFTAEDLFNECYGKNIVQDYKTGKLKNLDSLIPDNI